MDGASSVFYQNVLMDYWTRKRRINPQFSLRAFARFLEVSPAQLSQIISGKRNLTLKTGIRISDKLRLSPAKKRKFVESIHPGSPGSFEGHPTSQEYYQTLMDDEFRLISEWYHFAILSLGELKSNQAKSTWIAQRLGIDPTTAQKAYDRLKRLKLIQESHGKFKQTSRPLKTTTDIPSSAIRKYHHGNLELAAKKLEEVNLILREFSSVTMAIDLKHLPRAKELITQFKRDLCEELENGEPQEVYTLAIQLFPVTLISEKFDEKPKSD